MKEPVFYRWLETESNRGSEEIASALISHLDASKFKWPKDVTTLRLFCDGCGGQNKNKHMVHALGLRFDEILLHVPSLSKIVMYFPVRGHSFLPCDRVFGIVERKFKKIKDIMLPSEYDEVHRSVGNLKILNESWHVRDFKQLEQYFKPMTGIQEVKRVLIKRASPGHVGFRMEIAYNFNDPTKKYVCLERSKKIKLSALMMLPVRTSAAKGISAKKAKDIESLLETRFGPEWHTRDDVGPFYKQVLCCIAEDDHAEENEDNPDEPPCNCLAEDACNR